MYRILFVCTGNICRTPIAAAILQHFIRKEKLETIIDVESAGTWAMDGNPVSENTRRVCQEHGLDVAHHRARHIDHFMVKEADLILCMAEQHKLDLLTIYPHFRNKIFTLKEFMATENHRTLSVDDPYGRNIMAYRKTFREIEQEIQRIWPELKARAQQKVRCMERASDQ